MPRPYWWVVGGVSEYSELSVHRSPFTVHSLTAHPFTRSPVHPPLIGIGVICVVTYYNMVMQAESHGLAGLLQTHGQVIVLTAWVGVAAWVVVGKYEVWCSRYECMAQGQAYVYGGFRYSATAYYVMSHELVLHIQQ